MSINIIQIPLEDALQRHPKDGSKQQSFDFFDTLGTTDCLLDCAAYASRLKLSPEEIKKSQASHEQLVKCRNSNHKVVQGKPFTYDDLQRSAKSGCGSCKTLKFILDAVPAENLGILDASTIITWIVRHHGTLEVLNGDGGAYYLRLLNVAGSGSVFRRIQTTNGLAGDTSSDLSLQRVRDWMENCTTNHEGCGKGFDMALPSRLIDVTKIFRGGEDGVKLVETSGQVGTYMCLSHCWGKHPIHSKTENANLKDRLDFIPWSFLPASFQQAVELTRKLGIQYLWIDSLCIIQDNKSDWEKEAAQMVNVYRNAYATIAVSWSHDSRGGCYTKTIPPIYFRITTENGDELTITLAIGAKQDELSEFDRVKKFFPLFNRAWCLQERLLSRRIIHCNSGEFAFDCGDGYLCECGGKQHYNWDNVVGLSATYTPLRSRSKYLSLLNNPTTVSSTSLMTENGKINPYERWHRVVSEYTCLNLTKTSDMLPALSGLARETAEITRDTYLAGLWKRNLEQDLMWHVITVAYWRNQRKNILGRDWVAPSWSWVSTGSGCKVCFPLSDGAKILEYKTPGIADTAKITCSTLGADPTGSVSSGRLDVKASRLPVLIHRPCSRWGFQKRWTNKIYGRFLLYSRENHRKWQEICHPSTGEGPLMFGAARSALSVDPVIERLIEGEGRQGKSVGDCNPESCRSESCKHCLFLRVSLLFVKGIKTDKGELSRTRDFFIVVTQSLDDKDAYTRVGLLEVICDDQEDRSLWFNEVWEPQALPVSEITIM